MLLVVAGLLIQRYVCDERAMSCVNCAFGIGKVPMLRRGSASKHCSSVALEPGRRSDCMDIEAPAGAAHCVVTTRKAVSVQALAH